MDSKIKLSETVRDYTYLILTNQGSTRGQIVGLTARNLDAQKVLLNTFEHIINRRVDIPEDIRKFQNTLQYARSKADYAIGESIYMLPIYGLEILKPTITKYWYRHLALKLELI